MVFNSVDYFNLMSYFKIRKVAKTAKEAESKNPTKLTYKFTWSLLLA